MKKKDLFIMTGLKADSAPMENGKTLVENLECTREFIFDLIARLPDEEDVSAKRLTEALWALEYLTKYVEYRVVSQKTAAYDI